MKTAMQLYAKAGKLFQEASSIFKYLGPNYVSQKDIDGCDGAVKTCPDAISKIKSLLNTKEQVDPEISGILFP